MAQNRTRDLNAELQQGTIDGSYIQLAPNRGGVVGDPGFDKVSWPSYRQAEMNVPPTMEEAFGCGVSTVDAIHAGVRHAGARGVRHGLGSPSTDLSMG